MQKDEKRGGDWKRQHFPLNLKRKDSMMSDRQEQTRIREQNIKDKN
jgi:hypothetical protein